jgi:hypothetical protein
MPKHLKKTNPCYVSVIQREKKIILDCIKNQILEKQITCPLGLASQLSLNNNDGLPSSIYYAEIDSLDKTYVKKM